MHRLLTTVSALVFVCAASAAVAGQQGRAGNPPKTTGQGQGRAGGRAGTATTTRTAEQDRAAVKQLRDNLKLDTDEVKRLEAAIKLERAAKDGAAVKRDTDALKKLRDRIKREQDEIKKLEQQLKQGRGRSGLPQA
jgi:TolA-binding protein